MYEIFGERHIITFNSFYLLVYEKEILDQTFSCFRLWLEIHGIEHFVGF